MLSERNYWRDKVLGCILFNIIVLLTLETVRDICWLANLPEISNTFRTTMKTKMATSPTMPAVSHSGEKIINNGATMHCHARPQIHIDPRISHSNLCRSEKNFTKLMKPLNPLAHDLQNLKILSPKMAVCAAMRHHNLSIHRGIVLQICANLLKISQN